jgi:hypothetical protein
MKSLIAALVLLFTLTPPQASISYFTRLREVRVEKSQVQNYAVVDGEIWMNAQPDLRDLRLYSGQTEIPYALVVERASTNSSEMQAAVLNLGRSGGAAQFVIEPGMDAEYDRITLRLSDDARDFVSRVKLEGTDDLHHGPWTEMGTDPIYDFSREKLGANYAIGVPTARFSFLRITIPELRPEQIKGASVAMTARDNARWSDLSSVDMKIAQERGRTVVTWRELTRAPVERLRFLVDPGQTNFRRHVIVEGIREGDGNTFTLADANIGRIHFLRGVKMIDSDDTDVDLSWSTGTFKVTIENGDDPPLQLLGIQPFTHERRIYFNPPAGTATALRLYYGDEELSAPVYDYAKLFRADPEAVEAPLGPGSANAAYAARPDRRPWTERHSWVLCAALVVAVVGLGAVALRGLRARPVQG